MTESIYWTIEERKEINFEIKNALLCVDNHLIELGKKRLKHTKEYKGLEERKKTQEKILTKLHNLEAQRRKVVD